MENTKVALTAVSLEKDATRSGGYPTSATPSSTPKKPPPCIMLQTGECQKDKGCRYEHVKVSEAELEDLKARRNAFYQNLNERGTEKERPTEKGRRAQALRLLHRLVRVGTHPTCAGAG